MFFLLQILQDVIPSIAFSSFLVGKMMPKMIPSMMPNITNTAAYTISIFQLRTAFTIFCFISAYHYTTVAREAAINCNFIWNVRYLKTSSISLYDVMLNILNPTTLYKNNTIILPLSII